MTAQHPSPVSAHSTHSAGAAGGPVHDLAPRLIVFGVGGAGGNAVDNMIASRLDGVEFVAANTDAQALSRSRADKTLQLGETITRGLGAGARPEIGAAAAEDAMEAIRDVLTGAHMVFITAGLGGGTGTGAAPVIARVARELGVLSVAVVTKPFAYEGIRRMTVADEGLAALSKEVDTMIVVPNQNLFRIADEHTTFSQAFAMADDVLHAAVRGVADLITRPSYVNLDFADVRAVLEDAGPAMMGVGEAMGADRARDAARAAVTNPLLEDISLAGAGSVLINVTGSRDMTLYEMDQAANEIRSEVDPNAHIIVGSAFDDDMGDTLRVAVLATGMAQPAVRAVADRFPKPRLVTDNGDGLASEATGETPDDSQLPADHPVIRRKSLLASLSEWMGGGRSVPDPAMDEQTAATTAPDPTAVSATSADRDLTHNPFVQPDMDALAEMDALNEDELEIPAFLRRQAG